MQWIFLIGEAPFSLDSFSDMQFPGSRRIFRRENELQIQYPDGGYLILEPYSAEELQQDTEPSEYAELLQKLPFQNPVWIMLKYRNIEHVRNMICENGFPEGLFIDCDGTDPGLKAVFGENRIIGTEPPAKS